MSAKLPTPPPLSTTAPAPRWLRALLRPGVRLMQHMRLQSKLALMATAVLTPTVILMGSQVHTELRAREHLLQAQQGVERQLQLAPLVSSAQRLRSLNHLVQAGDARATAARDGARGELKLAIETADRVAAAALSNTANPWARVRPLLLALADGVLPQGANQAFDSHVMGVQAARDMVDFNAETAGLLADAAPGSHHPAEILFGPLDALLEVLTHAQALGAALRHRTAATETERAEMLALVTMTERFSETLRARVKAWGLAGGQPPLAWSSAHKALLEQASAQRNTFGRLSLGGDALLGLRADAEVINQMEHLRDNTTGALRHAYVLQLQAIEARLQKGLAVFGIALCVLGYLLVCFALNFQSSVRGLRRATDAIAAGDLSHSARIHGSDELAEIGAVMNRMSERLSNMVAEIRNSASLVNQTGQQVSDGSARLAQRTDDQAGSLRTSIAAINQLSAAVSTNADAAHLLDGLTEQLAAQAEEGNAAMQDTVHAMQQMQQASGRVAEVVAVIDDVAFQTGMLSLNAAIEAAHAGEAGKGFAVVASEVRQLARRCAESAEEIRKLIGDAGEQVDLSSGKIANVSSTLSTIVAGVREVSQKLRGISNSSAEQSAGLAAVTESVGSLDEITRENAALVEESTTASNALVTRAGTLREAVASMQLRQGSADEALAMVKKAVAHFNTVGKAQAVRDFHQAGGDYLDRDLYVFALDRHGTWAAVGNKPDLIGQSFTEVPGLDKHFLDRVWAAASQGGGWVAYQVINRQTQAITPKESYILPCGPDLAIGCGIYRNQDSGPAFGSGLQRAAAWSTRDEQPAEAVSA